MWKKQFGAGGVCEDLVVCGVQNPARVSDGAKFKESGNTYNLGSPYNFKLYRLMESAFCSTLDFEKTIRFQSSKWTNVDPLIIWKNPIKVYNTRVWI